MKAATNGKRSGAANKLSNNLLVVRWMAIIFADGIQKHATIKISFNNIISR